MIMRSFPSRAEYNCTVAAELLRYYRWLNLSPVAAAKLADIYHIILLPNATYDYTISRLKTKLVCRDIVSGNTTVWAVMLQVLADEVPTDYLYYLMIVILALFALLVLVYFAKRLIEYCSLIRKVNRGQFQIPSRDIVFIEASKERYTYMLKMRPYLDHNLNTNFVTGEYGFCVVLLRPLQMAFNSASLCVRQDLINMQEWRTHKNLARFIGVTEVRKDRFIVSELSTSVASFSVLARVLRY